MNLKTVSNASREVGDSWGTIQINFEPVSRPAKKTGGGSGGAAAKKTGK
jgi:hypothetical protein